MKIQVDEHWWQYIFDELYLLTDARSVCNDEITKQEVNFLEKFIGSQTLKVSEKMSPILDMCGGQGRHALELARRGFGRVTVLDYSHYLLSVGKKKAGQEKLNPFFVQGDARNTGFLSESFFIIIIMASSFGYFVQEEENEKILLEAYRLLKPSGNFLLDLPDREYVLQFFKPLSNHRVNEDIMVIRQREIEQDIIYCRERVISEKKGCIRDKTYCTRLYSPEKIIHLLQETGFSSISFQTNFMNREKENDFGCITNRMIVYAKKI